MKGLITLSNLRSRTFTAHELVASGRCTADCLTANPDSIAECVCRCRGMWHGGVAQQTARTNPGW